MKGSLNWFAQATSHYLTMWIGARYGDRFPMHFVCGYPRSGTTWLSELLADYLNLPRPRHYIFPVGFASVLQTHSEPSSGIRDCFYIIRDGRDVIVSLYYYIMDLVADPKAHNSQKLMRSMNLRYEPPCIRENLPAFIEYIFHRPVGTKSNWRDHTLGWMHKAQSGDNQVVVVRYEDLLRDTQATLAQTLQKKFGNVDGELANEAVKRQEFQRQRRRPAEQHRTTLRKGKMGDWRNIFSEESTALFKAYAGEALIELGYEKDHTW